MEWKNVWMSCMLASFPLNLFAASGTWDNGNANFLWQDNTNWSGLTFPNAVGDVATFDTAASGTISLAVGDLDLSQIRFIGTGSYTINTGGSLTFAGTSQTILFSLGASGANIIDVPLSGGSTIQVDQQTTLGDLTISGIISGPSILDKIGTGTLILEGANTYTGGTTVNVGTLKIGASGDINSSSSVTVGGSATLEIVSGSKTINNLSGSSSSFIELNASTLSVNQTTAGTYLGVISGTGSLTKTGAQKLTLSGTNTYGGGTTVTAGTLEGTTSSLQGDIFNNAEVIFDQTIFGSYTGVMSGSGALTKAGVGTLLLSGANSYIGGTTVEEGILEGTTTSLQGEITNNAVVVFDQAVAGTYSGIMSGTGSLVKEGVGVVTLSGMNSYTNGTTVTAGTLKGTTSSLQGNILNNAAVIFDQGFDGTYAGVMSGTGSLVKEGVGVLTLSGTNTYGGGTTVTAGTLEGTTSSLQGNILNNAAVIFDQGSDGTYAGVISGTGTLTKEGVGIVTFTGANSFVGGTTINAGTILLSGTSSTLSSSSGSLTLSASGTFQVASGAGAKAIGTLESSPAGSQIILNSTTLT
ncbi:autotransporter-associated beta strand repeat-containing protein, partial [Chlamydiales bacterium]|nr:autotransporter-associated beta strand repeat-containing protein [Chlamydiales bacterium]